jgi:protein phosphatase
MTSDLKSPSDLANLARRVDAEEFHRVTENAIRLLSKENGYAGGARIEGRLVSAAPSGELTIVGDIHGDLESLQYILRETGFMKKAPKDPAALLVFLGDYGDRGFSSPEVYYVILRLKELFPRQVVLMRGNHEGPDDLMAHPHDLPSHMKRKFGKEGLSLYNGLRDLFSWLYNGVLVNESHVLLHGGAPSGSSSTDDIAYAHEKHPREPHLEEILWSDPREGIRGTYPSPRGAGKLFGEDVTDKLLKMLNVKALVRGHESSADGFKTNHHGKVITLFSRKGQPYFNEYGAYLHFDTPQAVGNAKQLAQYICKF